MAKGKRKGRTTVQEPFVSVPESWFRYLRDSHASAVEIVVFLALAQHPQRNGLLSRPVADYGSDYDGTDKIGICTATGIRKDQVTRALSNLCNKRRITLPDGTTTTLLTPVVKGHRGKVAVYRCNIPKATTTTTTTKKRKRPNTNTKTAVVNDEKDGTAAAQNTPELDGSNASTVGAQVPYHLEKTGGAGKDQPTPPWFR